MPEPECRHTWDDIKSMKANHNLSNENLLPLWEIHIQQCHRHSLSTLSPYSSMTHRSSQRRLEQRSEQIRCCQLHPAGHALEKAIRYL